MIYDAAIVGTGPAGVSAALNLQIHQKKFVWIGSRNLSDKIAKAEKISNYPGLLDVTGEQLMQAYREQIAGMQIPIEEHMVSSIMKMGDHFALMAGNEYYETRTVILATGISIRTTIENETEYLGRGVSYCATCDGALYRGRTIAVVSNNARFEHEVQYLSQLAGTVHFFPQYPKPAVKADNVVLHADKIRSVVGETNVNSVLLSGGESLAVDGVFLLRDSISFQTLLKGLEVADNHIVVDRQMATNNPGVYAAGDCTGRPYQYAKAVGEGNVAAHAVLEYLQLIMK